MGVNKTLLSKQIKRIGNTMNIIHAETFKKSMITAIIMATFITTSTQAYQSTNLDHQRLIEKNQTKTNNENIGFGTGAVIGGLAAGPIGAFVAGIGGALIAKFVNVSDENEELSLALGKEQATQLLHRAKIENQYQAKLEQVEDSYQQQLLALEKQNNTGQLQADNLLMSLQFSTGSSDIAAHYQEQVSALAQILNSSPDMKVDLSGYTDLTGEESLNQALSQARVKSVKRLLMAQGVTEQQIATFAFGEDAPVVANSQREVSFYDRRVVMKLHKEENSKAVQSQMAKNQ